MSVQVVSSQICQVGDLLYQSVFRDHEAIDVKNIFLLPSFFFSYIYIFILYVGLYVNEIPDMLYHCQVYM